MRKIIKIQEIAEITHTIEQNITILKNEKDNINNYIDKLTSLGSTPSYNKIINNLKVKENNLQSIIEIIDFYASYINNTMNEYDSKFSFYKNKLDSYIDELNDNMGEL